MTTKITRRRALAGVAGGAIAVPALALAAQSPDAPRRHSVLTDLWAERELLHRAVSDATTAENDAEEAIPKWAHKIRARIARLTIGLECKGCDQKAQREAIGNLKTPAYLRAMAKHEAAEKQYTALATAEYQVERQIADTPAGTISDVRIKLRLADFLIRLMHTEGRGNAAIFNEECLESEDRLALSAYADLKRLADGSEL